ncbi:MAG: XRE family transcriptional regulator [Variovorax sp.]
MDRQPVALFMIKTPSSGTRAKAAGRNSNKPARAKTDSSRPVTEHAERASIETLDRHLGTTIRELRHGNQLTISDVSASAGISPGMLSKIENGQTGTSLATLVAIANALGVGVATLFRSYDSPAGRARVVKAGEGMEVVRRGTNKGHTYHLLSYDQGPQKRFEPFLISMDDESEVFPTFQHPGTEFIHMLQGRLEYRHGDTTHLLEPGDSVTFNGTVPHGPERLLEVPIRFITVIMYDDPRAARHE